MDRKATLRVAVRSSSAGSDCVGAWGVWGAPLLSDSGRIRFGVCFEAQVTGVSAVLTDRRISMGTSWSFTSTIQPFGLEVSPSKASDLMQAQSTLMQAGYKFTVW